MKSANYGPFYAAGLYPKLAEVFRAHGYALAVHGSLANDFDLIAVPWVENASEPQVVADECNEKFAAKFSEANGMGKPHGRIAYKLNLSFADCALDVSFTPRASTPPGDAPKLISTVEMLREVEDTLIDLGWHKDRGVLKRVTDCLDEVGRNTETTEGGPK